MPYFKGSILSPRRHRMSLRGAMRRAEQAEHRVT